MSISLISASALLTHDALLLFTTWLNWIHLCPAGCAVKKAEGTKQDTVTLEEVTNSQTSLKNIFQWNTVYWQFKSVDIEVSFCSDELVGKFCWIWQIQDRRVEVNGIGLAGLYSFIIMKSQETCDITEAEWMKPQTIVHTYSTWLDVTLLWSRRVWLRALITMKIWDVETYMTEFMYENLSTLSVDARRAIWV